MIVLAASTALAQDREPTEAQLAQSIAAFERIFLSSPRTGKVWEGTQHLYDEDQVHVGFVLAGEGPSGLLQQRWVTWDGAAMYALPGEDFTLKHEAPWMSWDDVVDALPAGQHPVTRMTFEYRGLTAAEVADLSDEFLPLTTKTLYKVRQVLLEPDGTVSGLGSDPAVEDGWLLRVSANGAWQDHWTFYDTFEPDEIAGVDAVWYVTVADGEAPIGSSAGQYYQWAHGKGANWWAFLHHQPAGTVTAP